MQERDHYEYLLLIIGWKRLIKINANMWVFNIPTAHKMNEGITLNVGFICRWRHLPPPPENNDSWTVTLTRFSIYFICTFQLLRQSSCTFTKKGHLTVDWFKWRPCLVWRPYWILGFKFECHPFKFFFVYMVLLSYQHFSLLCKTYT